jgi:hypothetical protein
MAIGGSIKLKLNFKEIILGALMWLRVGTNGGLL